MLTYSIGYWEVYRRFQGGFFLIVGGGRGCAGGSSYEGSFHERRDIAVKGARDFPALFKKKDQKLNKNKKQTTFSTESKEQHQN